MLKRLLLLVLCALPAALAAQTLTQPKFGYLNYAEVLKTIPQYAEAQANLARLQGQYDAEIQRSEDEFTRKYAEFLQEQKDFPENIMVKRHKELQELMEKSIAFKREIQATLKTARDKMLEPLTAELDDAISRVALKYNLDYVVNTEEKTYLFINPSTGMDITNDVQTELGIRQPATGSARGTATTPNSSNAR